MRPSNKGLKDVISDEYSLRQLMPHYMVARLDSKQTSSPSKLHLEALEVSFVLNNLHEWLSRDIISGSVTNLKIRNNNCSHRGIE